jgi:WD40 repeat protein
VWVTSGIVLETAELVVTIIQEAVFRRHDRVHRGGCNDVAFSGSGLYVASCGQDGTVRLWTAQDGNLATEMTGSSAAAASSVNSVAFAEERGWLLAACSNHAVRVWDMQTARTCLTMTGASFMSEPRCP